jgi:nucleotide-binding universal stress UspA family protein
MMITFPRIMVALDMTGADEDIIRYTEYISKIYRPDDIYFVHVAGDLLSTLDFPFTVRENGSLSRPADEELSSAIHHRVHRYFSDPGATRLHVDVLEGKVERQLTHWAAIKKADLVLIGRHRLSEDGTVLVKRLVRNMPCSVLVVPEETEPSIGRIVTPVDFSAESVLALQHSQFLAGRLDDVEVCLLHIFDIPPGHFQLSRSTGQFERIMGANAREALEHFLQKADALPLLGQSKMLPAEAANPSREIVQYLDQEPADLLVVGARGHSVLERFLVGSVTEGLLDRKDNQVLLVLRPRGQEAS